MPTAHAPTLSTLCFAYELAAFESLGVDVERVLGQVGLSRERLADPKGRVPVDLRLAWWDAAVRVSGDPALGLRVGAMLPLGALGSFEYLLRHSASLEQAAQRANEYMRLVDDTGEVALSREGDLAVFRARRTGGYPTSPSEIHTLFAALYVIVGAEWPGWTLTSVSLAHAAPRDPSPFLRHFGCPVRFDAPDYELRFPARVLDGTPRCADAGLSRVLEEHSRRLLAELPDESPLLQSARVALATLVSEGSPSAGGLARALGMSERTLRRRLEGESTTYNEVLDGLRRDLARRYVAQTQETFEAIAERLAFADASTFFRAFKRWTGKTPAHFREEEGRR
jgi:AraC-like DNA-binding protein